MMRMNIEGGIMNVKKVSLSEKCKEYDMKLVNLRSRRSDDFSFPNPVGHTTGRYPEKLYIEAELDHWYYNVYSPKRREKRKQPNVKVVRVAAPVKEPEPMSFDEMAVLFVSGKYNAVTCR